MDTGSNRFSGVDQEVLDEFLCLIRDYYSTADNAYFFLEHHAGVSATNSSIANLRDILSHLYSLLGEENLSSTEQREQIASAKEHIRRAIFEPYELALAVKASQLNALLWRYRYQVVTLKVFRLFPMAPDIHVITGRITVINELKTEARHRKRLNRMSEEWEEGVKINVDAFLKTLALCQELDEHCLKAIPINLTVLLGVAGIVIGIFSII